MSKFSRLIGVLSVLGMLTFSVTDAQAALLLDENFDDITTLFGSGWTTDNLSSPVGNDWFQGNSGIFASQAGAPDSYIANNFLATSSVSGFIDTILISPTLALPDGGILTFYTRTADPGFLDRLEVRFSDAAGDQMLTAIGSGSPYPTDWQGFSVALPATASGRFAFAYVVDSALDADYIGIDTVQVNSVPGQPVPEPSTLVGVALGLTALRSRLARRRAR